MHAGNTTLRSVPRLNTSFQKVLLDFATAAASGMDPASFLGLFLRSTKELFKVSGTYFWRVTEQNYLVGEAAYGHMAEEFRGITLRSNDSAVASEAVRTRRTVFVNDLDEARYPTAGRYQARSIMAAPLIVGGEVTGAIVFLDTDNPTFFNEDLVAKATILAGQLGTLLEVARLIRLSGEQRRRGQILIECLQVLQAVPDISAVLQALAERFRIVFSARFVCVVLNAGTGFSLKAVAAESSEIEDSLRKNSDRVSAAIGNVTQRISLAQSRVAIQTGNLDELSEFAAFGISIAAPLRTNHSSGAVLAQLKVGVGDDDLALFGALANFGSLIVANAELFAMADSRAHEFHQLLEIVTSLGSTSDLDQFLQRFVVKAAEFLGFDRSYVALLENESCRLRWIAENGTAVPLDILFPRELATRVLSGREVFWSDNLPDADKYNSTDLRLKQILSVPLLGADGKPMGVFGVLDRADKAGISAEDIRRARALAAQVVVALETAHHLHVSELHRRRSEDLMGMALEFNTFVRLPDFARKFTSRAAELLGVRGAALAVVTQKSHFEIAAVHGAGPSAEPGILRRLAIALRDCVSNHTQSVFSGFAVELLGSSVANAIGWEHLTVARLSLGDGELIGLLCLADPQDGRSAPDEYLLQALAGHASVALENARLFTRMEQANRHWIEVFDAIGDFIVVHDEAYKVLRVNRSLAEFIGVPPAELISVDMQSLVAMTGDNSPTPCPFCHAGSETSDEYVHSVLERTYLVSSSRIHAANNDLFQTVHVLKDITDRREAERRYRELFDNIQEGLFFCSPEGRFIEVNEALVRMLGYDSREEVLQLDAPGELYFSPGARSNFLSALEQKGSLRNYEVTLRRKDGSPIHVLQNVFAVRDTQGRMVQFRGLMLDITELKDSQAELQRERDFNNKILNNTQSIILVTDTAGQITYANRRWYETGYQPQQFIGEPLAELVAPSRREVLHDALVSTLNGHQVDNLDLAVMRGDGRVAQFSVNLSPMRDEQGDVASIVVVMTDVTDSAMLQAKLVHTERMAAAGQLVSGVAHEVNNPLTAILGFADLLMERPEVSDNVKKDLRVILQEAQRTKQIVQNLLSFARQMPPQRAPVQLNAILRRTLQLRSYDLASHGVEVVERFSESLPEVIGDSQQLQQVFLNILNNAYDAVRETGRPACIEVETGYANDWTQVTFTDNGNGIEFPERIFDPFFTTKEVGKGTGLGLSICYGIVREHGGEILCHNNMGKDGATFIVRLPTASEDPTEVLTRGVMES